MTLTVSSPRSEAPRWRRWAQAGVLAGLLVLASGVQARAATAIGARGWDHGDYGRLVFDLGPAVSGRASLEGDTLVITFSEAVTVDPKAALGKLARFAGTAQLSDDGRTLRVALKLPVTLKPETYQGKLVVDLRPAAAKPAPSKPAEAKPAEAKPRAEAVPARPAAAAAVEAAPPPQQPATVAPPPAPVAVMPAPAVAPPVAPPGPVAAATPAPAATAVGEATMQVRAALGGVEVEAGFSAATGAVAFARGDAVWVVFDRPGFDAAALMDTPLGTLGRIEPLNLADASGFRLVGRQLPPEVTADGNRWRLVFGPDARPPATPLVVGIATDSHGNRQLAIKVAGARPALSLIDPDIGDAITVVPVTRGGAGILAAARLPDLSLLASTQGIAFLALSDGLETRVGDDAVVITGPQGGLTLSGTPPAVPGQGRGPAQAGLDVGIWAVPGNVGEVRAQLAHEASMADSANRQQARMRFARYLVTQGLGAEAIGLAKLIMRDDPALADDLGFRQMRGIAQAMQERPAEALTDLGLPALEFSPDAVLWRGYALAAQGQAAQAHRVFAGMAAIDHYPAHIATRLLAAMAETALAADDLAGAADFSRALGEHAATAATRAQAQALAGRIALRNADVATAREQFGAALASGERIARVDAELGLIELGLADGTMTRPQAIERLDRLRYAWRGDAKELAVLRRLADLQLAEGRWRDGLETLRVALKLFPEDPGRDALAETQAAAFRRLFLSGAADALPPVQAVALYFDYRDLTPLGAEGDEMIRRLADRLIQVELLDQAKTLLAHQVTYRLQGIAQAQVAANLALLHLTDHEAAKALAVLDGTEQPTLPEATARLRRLLRAGALADLGRGAEARALLAGDTSEDAARLGAEIAWNARDWAGAADSLGRLLANAAPPAGGAPGAATERLALRLAIAAALAKDVERLKALAQLWGPSMAQSKSAEAFAMLTGATDPSAIATRNLAQTMANAGADTGFMDMLRQRMAAGQLNAIN